MELPSCRITWSEWQVKNEVELQMHAIDFLNKINSGNKMGENPEKLLSCGLWWRLGAGESEKQYLKGVFTCRVKKVEDVKESGWEAII